MVGILDHVTQEYRGRVDHVQHDINVPVVEQIAERGSTRRNYYGQSATCGRRYLLKFCTIHVAKQERALCARRTPILLVHARIYMPVGYEQIKQTVVVVVKKTGPPSKKRNSHIGNSRSKAHISEAGVSIVAV